MHANEKCWDARNVISQKNLRTALDSTLRGYLVWYWVRLRVPLGDPPGTTRPKDAMAPAIQGVYSIIIPLGRSSISES